MREMDWRFWGLAVLGLGVALGGALAGRGFAQGRAAERYVTVKGVSEREVQADLAVWPLQVVAADNDLAAATAQLARGISGVREFIARNGLDSTQVALTAYAVEDAAANQYSSTVATNRFVVRQTLVIRSTSPAQVLAASQRVSELASAGVAISSAGGTEGPTFLFTKLNDLKPEMIAEATARAREAAEQFASDAGSRLGGIRRANQGVFEILARDQAPGISQPGQLDKTVRVVSTIEYSLE
jgi:uncharacterized protein